MATHTITIVETENGQNVVPPYVVAEHTDSLRFVNLTSLSCQILVPADTFRGPSGDIFSVGYGGGAAEVRPIDAGERKGSFPYQVYLELASGPISVLRTRRFAVGQSAPHIIIE